MAAEPPPASAFADELRTRQQQLELIFNSARDMMLLARVDAAELIRVVSVNRTYVETIRAAGFALGAQDFEGRTFAEIMRRYGFDPVTVAQLRARYEEVIVTRRGVEFDEVHGAPSGIFHGRTTITPILDAAGQCAFVLYSSQDVTALRRAERERADSERALRAILDHSFALIGLLDPAGRVLRSNQTALQLAGTRSEDVVGRFFWETPWWNHDPGAQARLQDAVRRAARGEFVRFEATHPDAAGKLRHIDFSLKPVHDEQGAVVALIPEGRDITERLVAERALHDSEETFAKAFRVSPDAISISELASGRMIEVNEGFEKLSGYARTEIIGRTADELGIWVEREGRERLRTELQRAGTVRNLQVRVKNRLGQQGELLVSAEKVEIGGLACLVTVAHDIRDRLLAEQALRESEEKFAKAFQVSPDIMAITEFATGRYLEVNEAHERLFGFRREETIGRTPEELGLLPAPALRTEMLQVLERDGRVQNFRIEARNRRGEPLSLLLSAERIRLGGRDCVLRCAHDITEQVRAVQALRESEEKFAKAFRASPDAISISELATGKFLDVNEGFERLSGYRREELIGRTALELGIWATPEERAQVLALLGRTGSMRNRQVQARSRSGALVDYLMSAETVEIGGQACLVLVSHDISEQLVAERALRESEDKFAKAFLASPHPLIITEIDTGRYIDVNVGFEQLSGYGRAEVIGRTALEINIWENPDDRAELFRRLQTEGMIRDMELKFRRKDGRRVITRCAFECIELAGRRCLLSTIEDITARRQAEDQQANLEAQMRQNQKLEALGTLAGGIAHDFNNILTAIIVNQELALMDLDQPADLRRRLAEIGQASGRAKELVRQILTFSRQQTHERLRQHLQMIVREALGLLRASLPATIEISQDLSPEAPPVLVDASQIHQVVMNLCTNAAHAMRDRPGRLTVRLGPVTLDAAACLALPGLRPGPHARLSVTDTGHGMEAAVLARIFEPFFTTKGPGEGTGLGLAMVHGIVRDHDGAVFVQSVPGTGTNFDLYFPEAVEAAGAGPAVETKIVPGRGETVLVVDDEEAICEAIGAMLTRIGYRVQTFTDPRMALERFRASPAEYNLLLTDRTMPYLSGPELIARVREWRPGVPVLLMSGLNGVDEPGAEAPDAHYGLVAKPIDIADLSHAVRHVLKPTAKP